MTPSIEWLKELLRLQRGAANIIMSPALAYDLLATLETLTLSAGEDEQIIKAGHALAEDLRARGYWQREIVLRDDGGYEDTWRTKEGYDTLASPPLPNPDIEGRAREMLADELEAADPAHKNYADAIRRGSLHIGYNERVALRVIVKALSLPTTEIRREAK